MNLYNKETTQIKKYVNQKGSVIEKCGVALSDFIEVPSQGIKINSRGFVKDTNKQVHTIAAYNPDKEFIKHIFLQDEDTYIPEHNYKYIRINIGEDKVESLIVEPL